MAAKQTLGNGRVIEFDSVPDKNGKPVAAGDEVDVGEPGPSDIYNHAFRGTVVDVDPDNGVVSVTDQDDDCYDVDGDKVEAVA